MVDSPTPQQPTGGNSSEKPFALRSVVYTAGFLLFILGLVPSVFYLIEQACCGTGFNWKTIGNFWSAFQGLVGHGVFAIGLATYLFCSAWLIFHGRGPHVEFDPPKHFVATGPYRWVRNPVVITLLICVLGEAIALGSWGILILLLAGMPIAHAQVTKLEEPLLRQRFGQSYIDYCNTVNRWLPKPPRD